MRVHEIAKQKGVSSKEILAHLAKHGITLSGHMAVLPDEAIALLNKSDDSSSSSNNSSAQKTVAPTQPAQKKTKGKPTGRENIQQRNDHHRRSRETVVTQAEVEIISLSEEISVGELAILMNKAPNELIFTLLKNKIVRNINAKLTFEEIEFLGDKFGVLIERETPKDKQVARAKQSDTGESRLPVVVVMGHVDHGKTTLLDYLRKTNVADKERGGITQHLGAYEVKGKENSTIFLDTPGHEAFSYMRNRGTRVTDIVILIVAANDGVKPQTIEAIELAKKAGVPIIVALNKIDKIQKPEDLDQIKTQLTNHDLVPEEWGGDTVFVGISAKTGEGIPTLLEMISLHAEMLDLKAEKEKPGEAFVLETKQQKGLGLVATVLCKNGTIRIGDYFSCGSGVGKVRILIDSFGKKVKEIGPSVPAQLIGFDNNNSLDDWVRVIPHKEYLEIRSQKEHKRSYLHNASTPSLTPVAHDMAEDAPSLKLFIKADTQGSCHALVDAIDKITKNEKFKSVRVEVLGSDVGDITEGDVIRALDADALLYGLHVKAEKNALIYAKNKDMKISLHGIIYHLVEEIEDVLNKRRTREVKLVKTGGALVLKVFPLKNNTVIAGCGIKSGALKKGDDVVCLRNGIEVGRSTVKSLQREKKTVKEVRDGQECGFITENFHGWQPDDVVEIYSRVVEED